MDKTDSFLLIAIFLGLFALAMWRLLIYTDNTVRKYSPLKISRSYEITSFRYFTRIDNLIAYYFGAIALYCLSKIPDTFSPSVYIYDWRNPATLIFISLLMLSFPAWYFYLDYNYWLHTRNIRITYFPDEKTVEVDFPAKTYTIRNGDISHIEMISSAKMYFCYSIYSLANGESFILTNRMPGTWAIDEYFKRIPFKKTEKRFPLIK